MSSGNKPLIESLRKSEAEIQRLRARIQETYRDSTKRQEYHAVCAEFHARYDQLAFPGGWSEALKKFRAGDITRMEEALTFLEIRPYFFRSGYMHQQLRRALGRLPMTSSQRARYNVIKERWKAWRKEFSRYRCLKSRK